MGMDRKIKKKKWTLKRISVFVIITLFTTIMVFLMLSIRGNRLNVKRDRLTISAVQNSAFQEYIPVTGTVIPRETRSIVATEGGRIEKLYRMTGSLVKKGDQILKLSNTNLLLDIMYREAELFRQSNNLRNTRLEFERYSIQLDQQLAEIKFNLIEAENRYKRSKYLFNEKVISREAYDTALNSFRYYQKKMKLTEASKEKDLIFRKQQIAQLESSLKRMKENLKIVKTKQDELTIRAPIDGLLSLIDLKLGESYAPGRRLGQIDIQDSFKVRADISEHYIARVEINRRGSFEYSNQKYRLNAKMIYPEVNDGVFKVDFDFIGIKPEDIRRGQTFHINFELGDQAVAILVPRGPFYNKTGGHWIFVLDADGKRAFKREIRIGRQNPLFYEVLDGLAPGERVITSSYETFGDAIELLIQ